MSRILATTCAVLALCACSKPPGLPVTLKGCDGGASGITANLRNDADRPVKSVRISADFYSNFRFVRTEGTATIAAGLNPGENKDVVFSYDRAAMSASGKASRCMATHVVFLDGTTADLPAGAR